MCFWFSLAYLLELTMVLRFYTAGMVLIRGGFSVTLLPFFSFFEFVPVDVRPVAGRHHNVTVFEAERIGEQPVRRFQKAVEFSGITNGMTGNAGFHPSADFARQAIAQNRLHAMFPDSIK